jgi:hypothetical protein
MSNKIESLTPEQEAHLATFVEKYSKKMTAEIDCPRFESALYKMYKLVDFEPPAVVYCDSPAAAAAQTVYIESLQLLKENDWENVTKDLSEAFGLPPADAEVIGQAYLDNLLVNNPPKNDTTELVKATIKKYLEPHKEKIQQICDNVHSNYFYTYWLQGSLAFAEAAEYIGVELDQDAVKTLQDFGQVVGYLIPFGNVCFVSLNPTEIHWQDDVLHNESGPAILYRDGFSVWAIEGLQTDEQVVMRPETQTLDQINDEENIELKRIRISRYGWDRYMKESNAEVLDTRIITLPSGSTWMESLMELEDMKVLFTYDPSTGRPYALEVDASECATCEDAQRYLLSLDEALRGCSFRPEGVLPVLRT